MKAKALVRLEQLAEQTNLAMVPAAQKGSTGEITLTLSRRKKQTTGWQCERRQTSTGPVQLSLRGRKQEMWTKRVPQLPK